MQGLVAERLKMAIPSPFHAASADIAPWRRTGSSLRRGKMELWTALTAA